MTTLLIVILVIIFGTLAPWQSIAQDNQVKQWHYLGELYLMFPNMTGETALGSLPEAEVDASAGEIFGLSQPHSLPVPGKLPA